MTMTLEEALKWADTWGRWSAPINGEPPNGDALALKTLADEVRRLQAARPEAQETTGSELLMLLSPTRAEALARELDSELHRCWTKHVNDTYDKEAFKELQKKVEEVCAVLKRISMNRERT